MKRARESVLRQSLEKQNSINKSKKQESMSKKELRNVFQFYRYPSGDRDFFKAIESFINDTACDIENNNLFFNTKSYFLSSPFGQDNLPKNFRTFIDE